MRKTISTLKSLGDYAAAMVGVAYIERQLELVMRLHCRELHEDDAKRLWDGEQGGLFGTFSAKIRVAYAFKMISALAYLR